MTDLAPVADDERKLWVDARKGISNFFDEDTERSIKNPFDFSELFFETLDLNIVRRLKFNFLLPFRKPDAEAAAHAKVSLAFFDRLKGGFRSESRSHEGFMLSLQLFWQNSLNDVEPCRNGFFSGHVR